jgi:hypothetical protein
MMAAISTTNTVDLLCSEKRFRANIATRRVFWKIKPPALKAGRYNPRPAFKQADPVRRR